LNILFISLISIEDINQRHLYADLMRYFVTKGHYVSIYTPVERRNKKSLSTKEGVGYKIRRVKTLNIQKTNLLEKAIGTLSLDFLMKKAIANGEKFSKFDLAIYTTPPITLTNTIAWVKRQYNCKTYLLLKDIFPQNAIDLQIMRAGSFIHKYFRKKEETLYHLSDKIGCMSQANVDYVLHHNPRITPTKVEICPNSIDVIENDFVLSNEEIDLLKDQLKVPIGKRIFIYGGNLGKPQAIDFLIQILEANVENKIAFFIIIGSGTEFKKLQDWINRNKLDNVVLYEYLPKEEYEKYVSIADVGLILLDSRFTIPNYPSRLLSYLQKKKPVVCFTDENTDIGKNAVDRKYGKWSVSNDLEKANELINYFCTCPKEEILDMGYNGYEYLKKIYSVERSFEVIMSSYRSLPSYCL
jgi:hypothetical protein